MTKFRQIRLKLKSRLMRHRELNILKAKITQTFLKSVVKEL